MDNLKNKYINQFIDLLLTCPPCNYEIVPIGGGWDPPHYLLSFICTSAGALRTTTLQDKTTDRFHRHDRTDAYLDQA